MQLERSYSRHLKVETYYLRAFVSALDLLISSWKPAVKTSRPHIFNELPKGRQIYKFTQVTVCILTNNKSFELG